MQKVTKIKENIKEQLPKTKKGKILGVIFGVVTPVVLGVVFGVVINRFFIGKTTDYSQVNASDLVINKEVLLQKYDAIKSSGKSYSDELKPYEMVNIGYILYSNYEHSQSFTKGSVFAAIVNQSIRGTTIRDGENYFEESLSKSSIVDVATRTYLKPDTSIDFYRGNATSATTATWNETIIPYTSEDYTTDFGKTPSSPLIYVVNQKTVLANTTTIEKIEEGYQIKLKVSNTRGVYNYVKQMKSISDLADYPAFNSCELTFTLNNDLLIKRLDVNESYYAKTKQGVGADSNATLTVDYFVDGSYHIPSINEAIEYPGGNE